MYVDIILLISQEIDFGVNFILLFFKSSVMLLLHEINDQMLLTLTDAFLL